MATLGLRRKECLSLVGSPCQEDAVTLLHCPDKFPLNGLPKEEGVKNQWLKFIFTTVPQHYNPKLSLCSLHFTEDCFLNLAQFNAGFSKRLVLKEVAVPSLWGQSRLSGSQRVSDGEVSCGLGKLLISTYTQCGW